MEQEFRIGIITKAHGIKGEVKVFPTSSEEGRYDNLDKCFIKDFKGNIINLSVTSVKYFKNQVILKFDGYDKIEDVESLLQKDLFVKREDAVPLEEGEYYVADILGAKVYDTEGNYIGTFFDYTETAVQDIYIIKTDAGKEIMIPAVDEFIKEVDTQNMTMTVKLIKGML